MAIEFGIDLFSFLAFLAAMVALLALLALLMWIWGLIDLKKVWEGIKNAAKWVFAGLGLGALLAFLAPVGIILSLLLGLGATLGFWALGPEGIPGIGGSGTGKGGTGKDKYGSDITVTVTKDSQGRPL